MRALLPSTELNGLIARGQKALAEDRLIGTQGRQRARIVPERTRARSGQRSGQEGPRQRRRALGGPGAHTHWRTRIWPRRTRIWLRPKKYSAAEPRSSSSRTTCTPPKHTAPPTEDLLQRGRCGAGGRESCSATTARARFTSSVLDGRRRPMRWRLNGLKKVGRRPGGAVRDAIGAGNADLANQRIADLAKLSPNHPSIPELRAPRSRNCAEAARSAHARPPRLKQRRRVATRQQRAVSEQQLAKAERNARGNMPARRRTRAVPGGAQARPEKCTCQGRACARWAQAFVTQANAALDANNLAGCREAGAAGRWRRQPDLPDRKRAQ